MGQAGRRRCAGGCYGWPPSDVWPPPDVLCRWPTPDVRPPPVVLSAGAIGTPKLLLLSGVGERASLERLGVPVVHHNPSVGRGLADGVYGIMQWASRGGDFVRCRLDSWGRAQEDAYCRATPTA